MTDMTRAKAIHLLGVNPGFNKTILKKNFRILSLKYHPDRIGKDDKFKEINQAYQFLIKEIDITIDHIKFVEEIIFGENNNEDKEKEKS